MSKSNYKSVHVNLTVYLNEDTGWYYSSPRVEEQLFFSIPLALYDSKLLAKLLDVKIQEMTEKYPEAVEAHRLEQEAKERAEAEAKIEVEA